MAGPADMEGWLRKRGVVELEHVLRHLHAGTFNPHRTLENGTRAPIKSPSI